MVELTASGDADQVEARLREALDAHGLQLFARIDHAAGARKADVELEANVLLIFGNPSVGTPLMQADPRVGIEGLPLRMLIWQDPDGTHLGYLDPRELGDRYSLRGQEQTLERQTAMVRTAMKKGLPRSDAPRVLVRRREALRNVVRRVGSQSQASRLPPARRRGWNSRARRFSAGW